VGVSTACRVLGVPRCGVYRERNNEGPKQEQACRPPSIRALSQAERSQVKEVLNSERFQDASPRQIWATLLDEGIYLCSWRTMYRILSADKQVNERRNQLQRPIYKKPELLATGPNQLWSWDITKVRGLVTWTYYYLYVILDVFSRYVVGWMIARQESAQLARDLIQTSCQRQEISKEQLTINADRGAAMISKSVALLLSDLGVTKTHSRPHVSNDNPFSEAQFKTMKYRPDYPDRFGAIQDVRVWAQDFFPWYNFQHHHTGLGLMTPATVHYRQAENVQIDRQRILHTAFDAHPERFVAGLPSPPSLQDEVWINKPNEDGLTTQNLH
jgi:putative transposase